LTLEAAFLGRDRLANNANTLAGYIEVSTLSNRDIPVLTWCKYMTVTICELFSFGTLGIELWIYVLLLYYPAHSVVYEYSQYQLRPPYMYT